MRSTYTRATLEVRSDIVIALKRRNWSDKNELLDLQVQPLGVKLWKSKARMPRASSIIRRKGLRWG